jgi:hypothetical protein
MFHVCFRGMCSLLLSCRVFYRVMSVFSVWLIVMFKLTLFYDFCLDDVCIVQSEVLGSTFIFPLLSISTFRSVTIYFIYSIFWILCAFMFVIILFVDLLIFKFFLFLCWVGVHCGIHKNSYNILSICSDFLILGAFILAIIIFL